MTTKKLKEQNATEQENSTDLKKLTKLKEIFRQWYGSLSVREIVSNKTLIAEIEAFERLLTGKEPLSC